MIRRIFFLGTHKRENITWNTIGKEKDWIYFAFSTLQKALEKKKKTCELQASLFGIFSHLSHPESVLIGVTEQAS